VAPYKGVFDREFICCKARLEEVKLKVFYVKESRAVNETPSNNSYWVSLAIWDHSVLRAICHK